MKKVINYEGRIFIFNIELYIEVEKRPNGAIKHRLTVKEEGKTDVLYVTIIDDFWLERDIAKAESVAMAMANNPESKTESRLNKLGFR